MSLDRAASPFGQCGGPLSESVDGVLLDLDGVVYRGPHAVNYAVNAINALNDAKKAIGYVTNNAGRTQGQIAEHLNTLGITADPSQVATAAQAAVAFIKETYGSGTRTLVVGGEGLRQAAEERGLVVVQSADDKPAVVVQGGVQAIGWADIAEAAYAINGGADYIASNTDATMPTERGIAPGNGALVAAVVHATGAQPSATGKPSPVIFQQASQRAGMKHPLVVGDRLDTDIQGANAAGMPSLHVLTGVDGPEQLLKARPNERPTFIAQDLRGLQEMHPAVDEVEGAWHCRGAQARWHDGALVVDESGRSVLTGDGVVELTLDGLRAACAAVWTRGEHVAAVKEIHILP